MHYAAIIHGNNTGRAFTPTLQGSKNAALPIIAVAVLSGRNATLTNVPDIQDVNNLIEIFNYMGSKIKWVSEGVLHIPPTKINRSIIPSTLSNQSRGSMYAILPAIQHHHDCIIGKIGGDKLNRSFVLQEKTFKSFGLQCQKKKNGWKISGSPKPAQFTLGDKGITASVIAIMLASLCREKTTIRRISLEPEVDTVISFIQKLGTKIKRTHKRTIVVTPARGDTPIMFTIPPDRVQAQTWILLAAAMGGTIRLPHEAYLQLGNSRLHFRQMGIEIKKHGKNDWYRIGKKLRPIRLTTGMFPEISSDIQPILTSVMTAAAGDSLIREYYYLNRFSHLRVLREMGAKYEDKKNGILLHGPSPLHGVRVKSKHGIRETMALITAGLMAEGTTIIDDASAVLRGYSPKMFSEINEWLGHEAIYYTKIPTQRRGMP